MQEQELAAQGFPVLEWGALHKGMTLDATTCAQAMGVSVSRWRDDRLLALKLKESIRKHRDDLQAHVRCVGDAVEILDDAGANEYNWVETKRSVRSIGRLGRRRLSIDHSNLSADQRRLAEARDSAHARVKIMLQREMKAVGALAASASEQALQPKPEGEGR